MCVCVCVSVSVCMSVCVFVCVCLCARACVYKLMKPINNEETAVSSYGVPEAKSKGCLSCRLAGGTPPEAPTSWLQVGTSPPTMPDSQSTESILGKSEHMAVTFSFFPNYVLGTEPCGQFDAAKGTKPYAAFVLLLERSHYNRPTRLDLKA